MKQEIELEAKMNGTRDPKKLTVSIHREEDAFSTLWKEWQKLAQESDSTICSTPEWVYTWWDHFGRHPDRSLHLTTIRRDGELVALAPMYTGHSRIAGHVVECRLQLLGSGGSTSERFGFTEDYGISDFLDILVLPEERTTVARLLVTLFESDEFNADRILFHQAREDSFVMQELYPLLTESRLEYTIDETDTCPYIELNGIPDLKSFIGQVKSNARRRFRQTLRANRDKEIYSIRSARRPEELDEMIARTIDLHQERWNRIGFPGVFHDERFVRFFRRIVHITDRKDWLWFRIAEDRHGICATRMLIRYNNRYYDYISGFDEQGESARYRPGIGLLLKAVEDGIDTGSNRIELLRGEESYKYDFTSSAIRNWKLTLRPDRGTSRITSALASLMKLQAELCRLVNRERRLLSVHRSQSGLTGMFPGYLRFRWTSLRLKLKQRAEQD